MSWVKIDDRAWSHPKIAGLSGNAVRLWLFALCWCGQQETDGEIPRVTLRILGGSPKDARELVQAALWHESEGGYRIHDYLEYQPSRSQLSTQRSGLSVKRSEAGSKGAKRRWQTHGKSDGKPDGKSDGKPMANEDGTCHDGKWQDDSPGPSRSSSLSFHSREPRARGLPSAFDGSTLVGVERWDGPQPLDGSDKRALEFSLDLKLEAQKFRDHHAAEGTLLAAEQWPKKFMTWLNRASDFEPKRGRKSEPKQPNSGFDFSKYQAGGDS